MKVAWVALSMSLLLGAWVASAQGTAGPSISSGVFTEAQAKRGDEAYQANCSSCHGPRLKASNPEAVDLVGGQFLGGWEGGTLDQLFAKMRDTMPPSGPNSLGDKTYVDVLAFVLSVNGFPAGDKELVPETVKAIVLTKKP